MNALVLYMGKNTAMKNALLYLGLLGTLFLARKSSLLMLSR